MASVGCFLAALHKSKGLRDVDLRCAHNPADSTLSLRTIDMTKGVCYIADKLTTLAALILHTIEIIAMTWNEISCCVSTLLTVSPMYHASPRCFLIVKYKRN